MTIWDERKGDVQLRDYDEGLVALLEAEIIDGSYFLPLRLVRGVDPPVYTEYDTTRHPAGTPMPGIPILWANPGDEIGRYAIPCVRVRREDPSPAMERWGSLEDKYRCAASGESPITVDYRGRDKTGYANYETQPNAFPYDIPYTVTCEAMGKAARAAAHILLHHCMRKLAPHSVVDVTNSFGETRKFTVFTEGPSELSMLADIRDRVIIYALSLRVQGELDLSDSYVSRAMTSVPTIRTHKMED